MAVLNDRISLGWLALCVCIAAGSGGCMKASHSVMPQAPAVDATQKSAEQTNAQDSPEASDAKEAPLTASVAQAFFVGDKLQVKVKVEAKTTIPTDQVVLSVVGLREGQVVETHTQALNQILSNESIYKGQSALATFELASQDLSEYQLQCRWGKDAQQSAAQVTPAATSAAAAAVAATADSAAAPNEKSETAAAGAARLPEPDLSTQRAALDLPPITMVGSGKLEFENVELEEEKASCAKPPCDKFYTLKARLVNHGANAVSGVTLAVGLAWSEARTLPHPPEDYSPKQEREDSVQLGAVVLKPSEGKKLKIKIDRPVPAVPGGSFYPYIRIVSATRAES